MEKNKNTIADEALMDIEVIRAALTENAKEILRAVTREEIDGVIKESLNEEDFEEDEVDADDVDVLEVPEEGEEGAEDSEEINADSEGEEGDDMEITDVEIETPESEEDSENMDDMELAIPDVDMNDDSEEIDLTDASDDMVISVYKELSGEDEIEVVGDDIHLSVSEPGEYILKSKDASVEMDTDEVEMDTMALEGGMYNEGDDCDEEVVYEVYMDEEESMTEDATEDCEETMEEGEDMNEEEEALEEQIPVGSGQAHRAPGKAKIGQPLGAGADNLKESKTSEYEKLMSEANKLKKENGLFKKNLSTFRKMLAETAVYNSNLTNVTRLFLEHATTKDEKKSIIKRFDDEVKTVKESKALYKRIVGELASAPSLTESVNVVDKDMTSGSSNLNSQTAYVDNETSRIKELMERVEGKKLL
tara:strand:- start:2625 stop:3884 length:1260 start_codon:yes stop_codon:yes gene_type:complete